MSIIRNMEEEIADHFPAPHKPMALAYESDQWSPINLDGLKQYTRQQLLLLRMRPSSQSAPKCKSKLGGLARIDMMPMFAKKSGLHPHEASTANRRNANQSQHNQAQQQQQQQPQHQHNKQYHHHHQQQASSSGQQSNQHQSNADVGSGSNKKPNQRNQTGSQRNGYKNKTPVREQKGIYSTKHILDLC